ncbi:hypothetical protein CBR_g10939 [Chara braunii]|uniref:CCHC-type domain-containing protein n=1 Tax=Chara braunii TaxID=69332 RepID=A0A388KPZ5_CHABU|nr:hypothetical protein CBR_g10939 [Chara braunii]|eukprot:GBG72003.1 hypothetical protein CBR_g10939 [Chara braunii]
MSEGLRLFCSKLLKRFTKMAGRNYNDYRHDYRRGLCGHRSGDYRRQGGTGERSVEGHRDRTWEHGTSSQSDRNDEPPRCFVPVCYECGESGHYRNQCPKLGGEGGTRYAGQQGRSLSPRQHVRMPTPKATSEDPAMKKLIKELAASIATMKEGFDVVKAEKEEKQKRKMEKQSQLEREKEERQAAEEARQAVIRKAKRKEDKKKREEEQKEALRKEMLMEISPHMGEIGESLQERYEREERRRVKGKLEARVTEHLLISEKRKRGEDNAVGDSPPMETPAKRTAKRKLQLGCRHQPMKKTPQHKTPTPGRRKIPAAPGLVGKLKFVTENLRMLGNLNVEELKRICQDEDVIYDGKKMQAILVITEKRTWVAYHEEEKQNVATEEVGDTKGDDGDADDDAGSGS